MVGCYSERHMATRHCTFALLLLTTCASLALAQDGQPAATFRVFAAGRAIGTEQVAVTQTSDGWSIAGSGRLEAPVNLDTRWFEARYDRSWHPLTVELDATLRAEPLTMRIGFGADRATATVTRGAEESVVAHAISPDTVVLSDSFFAAYEALARRLADAEVGTQVPAYFTGQGEIPIRLDRILEERLSTPAREITARRHLITFLRPTAPFGGEVWSDEYGRLLRLSLPSAGVEILREDIATVNARRQTLVRDGDEPVQIKSIGFTLAGTLSKPAGDPPPRGYPAVILVPSSTASDRDDAADGIPVAGLLASALADAGYYVVRYDRRGVAQSGGRPEAARLVDYAQDVRAAFDYLDDRQDVDDHRVVVIGRGTAGFIALQAAAQEHDIHGVVLIGTPSVSGADLVLEQQQRALEASTLTQDQQAERIALQRRIQAAVLGEGDWEGISAEVRRQADTAWFRSFLEFDPAEMLQHVRQAILIVQPQLDRQVPASHADRLAELADSRRRHEGVEVVRVEEIDERLIVPSDEPNADPATATLAPALVDAIVEWLARSAEG